MAVSCRGQTSGMGGDQGIGMGRNRIVQSGRFFRQHIRSKSSESSTFKCLIEILFTDQAATCCIDQISPWLHQAQLFCPYQPCCRFHKRDMQGDDIGLLQKLSESDRMVLAFNRKLIPENDFHSKSICKPGDSLADVPHPDNSESFVANFIAAVVIPPFPAPASHAFS